MQDDQNRYVEGENIQSIALTSGLASHFRNLMIAKDERTLKILEYTKDTIEKFKTQAALGIYPQ